MNETGPPPNPLADRLRERAEQEIERNREFLLRVREDLEINLAALARDVAEKQRRIAEDSTRRHAEHVETFLRSSNAEHERIEASYRLRTAALRKHGLTVLIVGTLIGTAIAGGVWGIAEWGAARLRADLVALEGQVERLTANVETLKTEAWGVTLMQSREGQRYVLLPVGTEMLNRRIDGRTAALVPPAPPPVE